nr:hypothetical protein [bacterium]
GGIYLSGTSAVDLLNSVVYGAGSGVGVLGDTTATLSATYNDVYGNVGGNYSGVSDPTGVDGNISSDPLFVAWSDDGDDTNEDLRLQSSSPCIDAGNPATVYDDADGTQNDMGAYGGQSSDWD